ncbi:isopenicillin N synthase family dioxygenase [Ruicaihuangia caeni]|uniref:isopenicillin N synthase family dioxygenase n=1 Tax=Ruicaihuangia caeni TaxID=3042517 RepID=UPI00338FF5D0
MPSATLDIPVIDIDRDPRTVGKEIDETLRTVGFFQITNHGVDPDISERCWQLTRAFFDLPLSDKLEIEREPGGSYGYFPVATESLAASLDEAAPGDLKESLNVAATPHGGHPFADDTERGLFAPARWPSALPDLQGAWEGYMREMRSLATRLMSIFALGLDLPADFFDDKVDRSPSAQRAINYPEQSAPPKEGQLRAGAHTDYGTLTILRQELGRGGLQAYDGKSEHWVDVAPVEGAYVINIGDLMARWTNDRWTSTLHRVVNPDAGSTVSTRRQTMPFFFNANYSQLVECLPTCLGPDGTGKYEPVLAGPHLAGKTMKSIEHTTM